MFNGRTLFMDDVAHITESDYALSAEIREHALQTPEWRNGYAPTFICGPDGKGYTLNGRVYFFDFDGHKGKELIPANDYIENNPKAAKVEYDERLIGFDGAYESFVNPPEFRKYHLKTLTWVIADWTDDYPVPFPYGMHDGEFRSWFGATRKVAE